jgi:hypothetical protein
VHRHEAILVQKLQHSMQRGDSRICATQRIVHKKNSTAAMLEERTRSVIPPARLVCICGGPFPSAGYFTAQTIAA